MQDKIRYLTHAEIDKAKWDKCVESAFNSMIYAFSWYLDITAPGWCALVHEDYKAVMPIPVRNKWGVRYGYQPYFTQQLGVFSREIDLDVPAFLDQVPKGLKIFDQNLNEANSVEKHLFRRNENYKLDISGNYSSVSGLYNRNCRRNIKRSYQADLAGTFEVSPSEFAVFICENLEEQVGIIKKHEYKLLEPLANKAILLGKGEIAGLRDKHGTLHAAGLYFFSGQRLIFSVCASTPFGKSNQAMYRLVDNQIQRYAGKFKWYDFSGSNIKGIAYFNSTFGAKSENYITIRINNLSWPIKLLTRVLHKKS